MKKYTNFINEEFNQLMFDCNIKIINIIKTSGYIVHYHQRIYETTLLSKKELISSSYYDFTMKYEEMIYEDVYSFIRVYDPQNYGDNYFLYPVDLLENIKNKKVINYQELPFYDELFEVLNFYNKNIKRKEFNL